MLNNKIFYHITLLSNLKSILKEGLIPNIGPQCLRCKNDNPIEKLIYLTDLRSVQKWKKSLFPNCRSCVILQVNCNNFSLIKRKKFIEGIEIGCREIIPPKNIKVMCLISTSSIPLIADKNITVFKIISYKFGFIYSPLMGNLLEETPQCKGNLYIDKNNYTAVDKGFIHAFIVNPYSRLGNTIVGIIPKGTEYYIDHNDPMKVAARYIKFNVPWYQRLAMNIRDLYERLFN